MSTEILSDVLRTVRLTGAVFFEVDAAAPWVAEAPATASLASRVIPGAGHVIEYHIVVKGTCWAARVADGAAGEPVALGPGSVVVFPHGDAHVLSSAPNMRATPSLEPYRQPAPGERLPFALRQGGDGPLSARLVCGFLGCDRRPFNPLIEALPRLLHVADGMSEEGSWLGSLIAATLAESRGERLGSAGVLARLSELIFIEVVRRYAESLPPAASGWLAALGDPQIGHALRLLHTDPAKSWTLAALAKQVGVSRSVLAERFTARLGVPPMTYLLNWRMQIAEGLLTGGAASIGRIAAEVGYESETAFSRAFKRCTGASPAVRRAALQGSA